MRAMKRRPYWPVLFFGPLPALWRNDYGRALVIGITALFTAGFSGFYWMFKYPVEGHPKDAKP
jgi:cell division protein FtsW (lipid II flippase)